MPRIRELTLDNLKVKIAPLSYDEFEAYTEKLKEMLGRDPKPTVEEWAVLTLQSVVGAMNRAQTGTEWDVKKLVSEFDMVTIREIFDEVMKMSGLVMTTETGEVLATSISR